MENLIFPVIGLCSIFVIVRELKNVATIYKMERIYAVAGITLGLIVSASISAPIDRYYIFNAIFYWVSQLSVLAFVVSLKPRPSQVAGASLALAVYLIAFSAWIFLCKVNSDAWMGYVISLPGAGVGAGVAAMYIRARPNLSGFVVVCITFILTLSGVVAAQALICNTIMHCSCK